MDCDWRKSYLNTWNSYVDVRTPYVYFRNPYLIMRKLSVHTSKLDVDVRKPWAAILSFSNRQAIHTEHLSPKNPYRNNDYNRDIQAQISLVEHSVHMNKRTCPKSRFSGFVSVSLLKKVYSVDELQTEQISSYNDMRTYHTLKTRLYNTGLAWRHKTKEDATELRGQDKAEQDNNK